MRSSPLGAILISFAIALAFAGVLLANMSWAVVSLAIASLFVYSRVKFASELETARLDLRREIVEDPAFANEPFTVNVTLINKSNSPIRGSFEDDMPDNCAMGAGSRSISKTLPPKSMLSFSYTLIPEKRGACRIPRLTIESQDAFGLFLETLPIEQSTIVNVHTRRESLNAARRIAGKEHFEFSGASRSPAIILRELEFEGIREYTPGDKARDIHWKLLPKFGELLTKTYKKEGTVQTMVFVDCSRSMRLQRSRLAKIDHALDISMQLSNVLLSGFHPAGVAVFDETHILDKTTPSLGRNHFDKIVKMLRNVPGPIEMHTPEERGSAAPEPSIRAGESRLTSISSKSQTQFLTKLKDLPGFRAGKAGLGIGLEGGIKQMIASSKGQEFMFIVVSDLISCRDSVVSAVRICKSTGNRILVIHTYDEWYGEPSSGQDVSHMETAYADFTDSLGIEGSLRTVGARYLRIGPADNALRIVRAIRRGEI